MVKYKQTMFGLCKKGILCKFLIPFIAHIFRPKQEKNILIKYFLLWICDMKWHGHAFREPKIENKTPWWFRKLMTVLFFPLARHPFLLRLATVFSGTACAETTKGYMVPSLVIFCFRWYGFIWFGSASGNVYMVQ